MDIQVSEQRHKNMAAIHGKDTKPEMIVRKYLWSHGFRYRLNYARLPGKPDIVLRMYKTCIFVNGCFWHGHEGCKYYTVPKSRTEFWVNKVSRNRERDIAVRQKLTLKGWHCITIWECELKPAQREATLQSLVYTLSKIYLQNSQSHDIEPQEDKPVLTYCFDNEDNGISMAADASEVDWKGGNSNLK